MAVSARVKGVVVDGPLRPKPTEGSLALSRICARASTDGEKAGKRGTNLADDDHVKAPGDLLLEGRVLEERLARKVRRPDVGVQAELLAQLEQALLGADGADAPLGAADGA